MTRHCQCTRIYFLFAVLILFICTLTTCTDDQNPFFDLTGTWTGISVSESRGDLFSADFVQWTDSTSGVDSVSGTIHVEGGIPYRGQVAGTHCVGVAYGPCPADVILEVSGDGNEMDGSAVDRPGVDCNNSVEVTMFRNREPLFDISGNWSGVYSGTDGDGSFLMSLTQAGSSVTGYIFSEDTMSVAGNVFGNDFVGSVIETNTDCLPTVLHFRISPTSMIGRAVGGGSDFTSACEFRADVTMTGTASALKH